MEIAHILDRFADQGDWLDCHRVDALHDLELLQEQLDHVAALPFEHRGAALNSILIQAAGALRQIERIDLLRAQWVRREPSLEAPLYWQLHKRIVTAANELRLAA